MKDKDPHLEELTWREQEVLALLAERRTNREIAAELHLAESTVKDYVSNILSKLYVKNRRQAVERAEELGLLLRPREEPSDPAGSLPSEPTPFVGRSAELAEIEEHLAKTRLLTLTGPGGIGKTRLALKAARSQAERNHRPSCFVSLAPIQNPDDIVQATAEALSVPVATAEEPLLQLLRYLKSRELLLVMDNFEHLLGGTGVISEIINTCPGVYVLATSRERLNVQGETVFPVAGLQRPGEADSVNAAGYEAVELFTGAAHRIQPAYDLTQDEIAIISRICRLVQGMPLAIELAAGWLHVLSLPEILDELNQSLDLLITDMRDIPERHRSIRAVFEHTWSLLNPADQKTFMQLSIFRGGFTREAAQAVTGASIQSLGSLVDKSVVRYRPQRRRFEIHELLRQYAQEQLESSPDEGLAVQQRHAAFFADFSDGRWHDLRGHRQVQALYEIEADIENVRIAWRHYLQNRNAVQLGRFLHPLWIVYWIKGWNRAAVELFRSAIAALEVSPPSRDQEIALAISRSNLAFFMSWLGLADQALPIAQQSAEQLEKMEDFYGLLSAYNGLSLAAFYIGDLATEQGATDRLLELAYDAGDPWALTYALSLSATSSLFPGNYPEAQKLAEAAIKMGEESGEHFASIISILTLGHVAQVNEDYSTARKYYVSALEASRQLGFFWAIENATKYLGQVAFLEQRYEEAETRFISSLKIAYDFGLNRDIANHLYEFARLRPVQGKPGEAVALLTLLLKLPTSRQERMGEGSIRENAERLLRQLEMDLGPDEYSSAAQKGATLDLDETLQTLMAQENIS